MYCNSCSEKGRGPRCAGWLRDAYAVDQQQQQQQQQQEEGQRERVRICVLEGGIKGFVARYAGDAELVRPLPKEVGEAQ